MVHVRAIFIAWVAATCLVFQGQRAAAKVVARNATTTNGITLKGRLIQMGSSGTYKAIVKVTDKGNFDIASVYFQYPIGHELLSYKVSPKIKGSNGHVYVNKTSQIVTWNPAMIMQGKSRTFKLSTKKIGGRLLTEEDADPHRRHLQSSNTFYVGVNPATGSFTYTPTCTLVCPS